MRESDIVSEQAGVFWLASYPKSGNTWFRIFLAHVLEPLGKALDLDNIHTGAIASSRRWVDDALGFDSADLSHDGLDKLRPDVYTWYAKQTVDKQYHKIHDAYTYLPSGRALIPAEHSLGALYFVRNPLDVAISLANHMNCSIDRAVELMGMDDFSFCKGHKKQHDQLRQQLLTWSGHVESWRRAKNMNLLIIRYEDMKQKPIETFTRAAEFLKLDVDQNRIEKALEYAGIGRLQGLEQAHGFREKPPKAQVFFRKGIVGDWKNTLTSKQVDQIIHDHGEIMATCGYL